jgi:hypothetical protein
MHGFLMISVVTPQNRVVFHGYSGGLFFLNILFLCTYVFSVYKQPEMRRDETVIPNLICGVFRLQTRIGFSTKTADFSAKLLRIGVSFFDVTCNNTTQARPAGVCRARKMNATSPTEIPACPPPSDLCRCVQVSQIR